MLKILNEEDKTVLGSANFTKNAVLYKDLIAFCEVYDKILDSQGKLPNFCFDTNGKLCVEGVCFLMKMYATEFGFETLKLTLDYLKILYYTMASFADDDGVVQELDIEEEFYEYKAAGAEFCDKKKEEVNAEQARLKQLKNSINAQSMKSVSMEKRAATCKVLAIVLCVLSVLGISGALLVFFATSASSFAFIASVCLVVLGFLVSVILLFRRKSLLNHASDMSYHVKNLKKELNDKLLMFDAVQLKYHKVFCEKNEYDVCFSSRLSTLAKPLPFEEILSKANAYSLLSYNVPYDIARLFKTQQREIDLMISNISSVTLADGGVDELSAIYNEILQQDWLFYNAEIKYHFLKKFVDLADKNFDWKIELNGEKINPYNISIRELLHENIAFSEDGGKKIILANLSDFTKTKYFNSLDEMGFNDGFSVDSLKKVKSNYLSHFYNLNALEGENVLIQKGGKFSAGKVDLNGFERIPTLVNLKLKVLESDAGLGNSDAKVITNIADSLFAEEKQNIQETGMLSEDDIDYPKFTATNTQEVDDAVVYEVNGAKKIGYKVD